MNLFNKISKILILKISISVNNELKINLTFAFYQLFKNLTFFEKRVSINN